MDKFKWIHATNLFTWNEDRAPIIAGTTMKVVELVRLERVEKLRQSRGQIPGLDRAGRRQRVRRRGAVPTRLHLTGTDQRAKAIENVKEAIAAYLVSPAGLTVAELRALL